MNRLISTVFILMLIGVFVAGAIYVVRTDMQDMEDDDTNIVAVIKNTAEKGNTVEIHGGYSKYGYPSGGIIDSRAAETAEQAQQDNP